MGRGDAVTAAAPSGVVTFLFTDVEGSTRRWENDADGMRVALAAHYTVLRKAIEAHGGWLFKHTGDGVCAAFAAIGVACDGAAAATVACAGRRVTGAGFSSRRLLGQKTPARAKIALVARARPGRALGRPSILNGNCNPGGHCAEAVCFISAREPA